VRGRGGTATSLQVLGEVLQKQKRALAGVGRLDAMQDHVHDPDHIRQAFLLLDVEGAGLKDFQIGGGQVTAVALPVRTRKTCCPFRTTGAPSKRA